MSRKVDVTHAQLGHPQEPGELEIEGLGAVTLTAQDINEWRQNGFNGTMRLIEGMHNEWQFIGWNFPKP